MITRTNEKELSTKDRINICKQCPICDLDNFICSNYLYLNPINNDVSVVAKKGYIKGCGCMLSFKTKNPNKHCPANKW